MRVLFVCTGNVCRSPMAEHLLRRGLARRDISGIEVTSAGTQGLVGRPVHEHVAAHLASEGIDTGSFVARRLERQLVESADLVLGASREHRAAAVTLVPRASARTFTIREFDRLLSGFGAASLPADPEARFSALVAAAASRRGLVPREHPEDDDIADPIGGPAESYPPTARLIDGALQHWLDLLAPTPGTRLGTPPLRGAQP